MTAFCYLKDGEMVEVGPVDWRAFPDEPDPDDDPVETPDEVRMLLGFDPNEDEEGIEKAIRKPDTARRVMDAIEARHTDERLRIGAGLARRIRAEVDAATSVDDLMRRLKARKETRDVAELADAIAAAAFDAAAEGTRRGKA